MEKSFEKMMQKFKKVTKEIRRELDLRKDFETWHKRKEIKLLRRLRKKRWNLRKKLKESGQLGKYKIKIVREDKTWKLKVKKRK